MPDHTGKTVREILKWKVGSVRTAPFEEGSPSWDDILDTVWEEIVAKAKANLPGYRTIKKLLSDQRFDK